MNWLNVIKEIIIMMIILIISVIASVSIVLLLVYLGNRLGWVVPIVILLFLVGAFVVLMHHLFE